MLPDIIDVPLEDVLAFAHTNLPDNFEGLFFKKLNSSWGLDFLEWEYTIPQDPKYYLKMLSPRKMSSDAGKMESPNLSYILVYCHNGTDEIVGKFSANYTQFSWKGHNARSESVCGMEEGWNLGIITDIRQTDTYAKFGFINAGAKALLNAFYNAGMRRVHVISDKINYRSIAFNKWLGFSDPICLSCIVPLEDETLAQTVQHYYFKAELKNIVMHMIKQKKRRVPRPCPFNVPDNISGRYDQYKRLQRDKMHSNTLMALKKIWENICQK